MLTYDIPTVTALQIPDGTTWEELDRQLREEGIVVAGSLGPLSGEVFCIGHMGAQADHSLAERAMDVLSQILGG
jgi:aspartate aminotransferase-like enzyme